MDGLGNPLYFQLSAGNVNDATMAVEVLSHVNLTESTILADKAYGTKYLHNLKAEYFEKLEQTQKDGNYYAWIEFFKCCCPGILEQSHAA